MKMIITEQMKQTPDGTEHPSLLFIEHVFASWLQRFEEGETYRRTNARMCRLAPQTVGGVVEENDIPTDWCPRAPLKPHCSYLSHFTLTSRLEGIVAVKQYTNNGTVFVNITLKIDPEKRLAPEVAILEGNQS